MPRTAAKTKTKEVKARLLKPFDFEATIDEVGKKLDILPVNLSRISMVEGALRTGSLSIDLISGGGYIPGSLITIRGETGAGKSTLLYSSVKNSTKWGIPVFFMDYEGSTSAELIENIIGRPMSEILGVKDEKGNYVVAPLMRYTQPQIGESGFRYLSRIMKEMPNKKEINGEWYLEYGSDWKSDIEKSDFEYFKQDGNYYVLTQRGTAQAIFFLDSYASMLPEKLDENDEANPMAQKARMFSEYLPMIKSKISAKRCTVVGTNQMRLKPMAMFSDPRYEPGGEALKFYPDVVFDCRPVSASTIKEGKGQIVEEPCWDGQGVDRYKFTKIQTVKNKKFSPFRTTVMKIWFESKGESKGGICPVFDCKQYLRETGQIQEGRTLQVTMPGPWSQVELTDAEFKALILNPDKSGMYKEWELKDETVTAARKEIKAAKTKKAKVKATKKVKRLINNVMDIRAACEAQIASGEAFKLYASALSGVATETESEDDESESTDMGDE